MLDHITTQNQSIIYSRENPIKLSITHASKYRELTLNAMETTEIFHTNNTHSNSRYTTHKKNIIIAIVSSVNAIQWLEFKCSHLVDRSAVILAL